MNLAELFESGRIVDIILVLVVIEAIALILLSKYKTIDLRVNTIPLLIHLLPGVLLFLALRAALTDASWLWIAFLLAASGVAHLIDIRLLFKTKQ